MGVVYFNQPNAAPKMLVETCFFMFLQDFNAKISQNDAKKCFLGLHTNAGGGCFPYIITLHYIHYINYIHSFITLHHSLHTICVSENMFSPMKMCFFLEIKPSTNVLVQTQKHVFCSILPKFTTFFFLFQLFAQQK